MLYRQGLLGLVDPLDLVVPLRLWLKLYLQGLVVLLVLEGLLLH
jgi:hypothetical protein